jgi:acetoin utilization deacetylase AcuC-like enzyme
MVEFPLSFGYLRTVPNHPRTGWLYSPRFLEHNSGPLHPEDPDRLRAIVDSFSQNGLLERMHPLEFGSASNDELAAAHTRRHIAEMDKSGGRQLDPDTFCDVVTPAIARLAAGAVLRATHAVMSGELTNAFCAVRPPGHHAPADRAMGFCYFNNVAVAAANVLLENPHSRVMIVDFDVHHGNGTQSIFYESDKILYASVHQYPFYPGTGAASEIGRGAGKGYTINKPLRAGMGDEEFISAIDAILAESVDLMTPDILLVSAGFDAHHDDPLANLEVSVEGFVAVTERLCEFAGMHCGGRIVSVLEGGYNLRALAESAAAHVTELVRAAMPD